jgi:acetyl esterase/lipase
MMRATILPRASVVLGVLLGLAGVLPVVVGQEKKQEPAKAANLPAVPPGVIYEPDVVYGRGGDTPLHLDMARPETASGPLACIVVIHGGGWRGGNYKQHVPQILDFAKQGFAAATVQYRLVPAARWPAQIEDVKCAVRYLRANAKQYGIAKDRIGAIGFSAGAHLAMLLGTMDRKDGLEGDGGHPEESSKVQAVVAYFGPTDLSQPDFPPAVQPLLHDLLGATREENPAAYKAASPVSYVDAGDAPVLIYHGTKDRLVPYQQAYLMTDALTKAGVPGRVELLLGADHGWRNPELARTVAGSFAFFQQHLHPQ